MHHVARDWDLPGERLRVEFDVLPPVPAPFAFNLCRYFALQHYTRPEWVKHANGVTHFEVVYCVENKPEAVLRHYEALFGVTAHGTDERGFTVSPENVELNVLSPSAWIKRFDLAVKLGFTGYRLRSSDLAHSAVYLQSTGVAAQLQSDGAIFLAPRNHV